MTQTPPPLSYQTPEPVPKNNLGLAGFIVSLVGFVGCGILAPVGLILSVIGLKREPRGFAIAGTVLGALGSILLVGLSMYFVFGVRQLKNAAQTINQSARTMSTANQVRDVIVASQTQPGTWPGEVEGNAIASRYIDAWQTPLRYKAVQGAFSIQSAGKDKVFDTQDDLVMSPEALGLFQLPPTATTSPAAN